MTPETVPTPTDNDEPQTKRADELKPGDWISAAFTETDTGDAAEVLSAHPFEGRTVVVYTGSLGEPYANTWPSSRKVDIAGADEIAGMWEQRAKWAIAEQLRSLADLVLNLDAPISIANGQVRITNEMQGIAEVSALSERLDIPVKVDTAGRNSVFWPRDRKAWDPGVLVEWYAYDPDFKKPDAAEYGRAVDNGDASAEVPNGVDGHAEFTGRATVPEQDCGWMTPSGPCQLVPDHPLFPFGPREDSGHISKASADANSARLAELEGGGE